MKRKKITTDKKPVKEKLSDGFMGKKTLDGFSNVTAKLGLSTSNMSSTSSYTLANFISRDRQTLDAAYRGSWLVGRVVDAIAEDMTKDGVSFFSEMKPDDMEKMNACLTDYGVWQTLCDAIKWSRLYGGAIAVILTDGADYSKPLRTKQVGKNTFRGLLVLDRWMVQPSFSDLITDVSKDMGMPKYYEVMSGINTLPSTKIHHSRVLRFDGIKLPYYQRLFENLWGLSVVERMLDRLLAFDSATTGAAQLLYKSHLRVVMIKDLREALAMGGATEDAITKQFEYIRAFQANEGITVLDSEDKFEYLSTTFSGIAELIDQFATQISGATNIPIVRLFGQSPSGFSTGETDLRNYYDDINKLQENILRPQLTKLFEVIAQSKLGDSLPEDFTFEFNPLWTLSSSEKSQIASSHTTSVGTAFTQGIVNKGLALKELRQQSRVTGVWTNITDEDIEEAEKEPPAPEGMPEGEMMPEGMGGEGAPAPEGGIPPAPAQEEGTEPESGGELPALQDVVKKQEAPVKTETTQEPPKEKEETVGGEPKPLKPV